jgi:hypothetical protein
MKTITPQIEHLKQMIALEEKRAVLQDELDAIVSKLADLQSRLVTGAPAASSPVSKASKPVAEPKAGRGGRKKRAGRGELKDNIFDVLHKAGTAGAKVTDIARSLGTAPANIYAWFTAALKRYPGISKVAAGTYRLSGGIPAAEPKGKPGRKPKAEKAPKAAKPAKKGKGGTKRGALRDQILAQLKSAGSGGITIKDLSNKIGANYRNLQVWFATTGKNVSGIKKVAPATYRLS